MPQTSRQRILALLGGARSDTLYSLVSFVDSKISAPLGQPLAEIGDKAMVRHLNALIHGVNSLQTATPASLKASKGSPIKGELCLGVSVTPPVEVSGKRL